MQITHAQPPRLLDLTENFLVDRQLQGEIDKAMTNLIEGLPLRVNVKLARLVEAVLAPSWSAHRDFQDEALFPMIAARDGTTPEVRALLERLSLEHAEIESRLVKISRYLEQFDTGRSMSASDMGACIRQTLALRRQHCSSEATLERLIPEDLDASEQAALERWQANRTAPFPINILFDDLD